MTAAPLPRDDRPGDYSGSWNQLHIRTVYPDTSAGVWHLALPEKLRGSYCGTFNPMHAYALDGLRLPNRHGGILCVGPGGISVGTLVREALCPWAYRGQVLAICPNCLSMARAAAELIGQRKYGMRALLREIDVLSAPPAPH